MKLVPPFPLSTIGQSFGANQVSLYSGMGLKGHPGIDFSQTWGTPIPSAIDAYCYLIVLNKNPAFYQDVCTIVEDETGIYEIIYGHISSASVGIGQIKQGQIVGLVGNTGQVFANGVEVSEADKLSGSHAGAHLHFQVRLLGKELDTGQTNPLKHYVNDGSTTLVLNGYRYFVPNFSNGYNGCVDPASFFDDSTEVIKSEVQVLNQTTDTSIRKILSDLIAKQVRKLLGF